MNNSSCWEECRVREKLIYCWFEQKGVQSIWKSVWRLLRKFRNDPPQDTAIPLRHIHNSITMEIIHKQIPQFILPLHG